MKKIALFLLLCIVIAATGCPFKALKTKPSTKLGQNELAVQINTYLKDRQEAYYCAMAGHKVTTNINDFNYLDIYDCANRTSNDGVVTADDKLLAQRIRNEAVENGVMAVNSVYTDFVSDINTGRATANFIADVIDLGTSATIGIAKGERPLQILGVALTAFRGGRKSADLNFFREQSTPILINKMDDNRATVYGSILLKKPKTVDEYTMAQAISDIVDYYNAGTLVRAFTQLSKETGAQALESEKKILQIQKIDPADIVLFQDKDSSNLYKTFFYEYRDLISPASTATQAEKTAATDRLRLIARAIIIDAEMKAKVDETKTRVPALVANIDKLAKEDQTEAKALTGGAILTVINGIFGSVNLATEGNLIKKIVGHIDANPIKNQ